MYCYNMKPVSTFLIYLYFCFLGDLFHVFVSVFGDDAVALLYCVLRCSACLWTCTMKNILFVDSV